MAVSLFAQSGLGQMRYSRERKPSPTPSPTPTPTPAQKAPFSQMPQTPPQRVFSPQQQAAPTPNQPRISTQRTFGAPQATPTPAQTRISAQRPYAAPPTMPTPTQTRIPAQRTFSNQQLPASPTPSPARISAQRTLAAPQPGTRPMQPAMAATPAPVPVKPTPTPVPPPDVKAYFEKQVANSKDQKFHMTVNGKDVALTAFHFWAPRSTGFNTTSTHIDMRGDDGRVYDIEFATTGAQITSIRIHRINGESVR